MSLALNPQCELPSACRRKGYGSHCRPCTLRAVVKVAHADPEFVARKREQLRALNADPEIRAKASAARRPPAPVPHPLANDPTVREIALGRGCVTVVDAEDYDWLSRWCWRVSKSVTGAPYAVRWEDGTRPGNQKLVWMHREILQPRPGFLPDHINRDTPDNRRSNLREATPSQNSINAVRKRRGPGGFRGVRDCSLYGRGGHSFTATIRFNKVVYYLGSFATGECAARVYDAKARELHGPFAVLNFPEEGEAA